MRSRTSNSKPQRCCPRQSACSPKRNATWRRGSRETCSTIPLNESGSVQTALAASSLGSVVLFLPVPVALRALHSLAADAVTLAGLSANLRAQEHRIRRRRQFHVSPQRSTL